MTWKVVVLPVTGAQAAPCFLMSFWKAGTCSTFSACAAIIDRLQLWLQQQCFEPAAKIKPDPVTSGTPDIAKMQPRRMWLNNLNLKRSKHCVCAHFFLFYLKKKKKVKQEKQHRNMFSSSMMQLCGRDHLFSTWKLTRDSAGTDNVQII